MIFRQTNSNLYSGPGNSAGNSRSLTSGLLSLRLREFLVIFYKITNKTCSSTVFMQFKFLPLSFWFRFLLVYGSLSCCCCRFCHKLQRTLIHYSSSVEPFLGPDLSVIWKLIKAFLWIFPNVWGKIADIFWIQISKLIRKQNKVCKNRCCCPDWRLKNK